MITHEEIQKILGGSDNDQHETITLELVIKKIAEYEKGRMILLTTEEYEKVISYIIQQQTQEKLLNAYKDFFNKLKIAVVEQDAYQYNEYVGKEEFLKYSSDYWLSYEKEDVELFKKIQQLEKELNL